MTLRINAYSHYFASYMLSPARIAVTAGPRVALLIEVAKVRAVAGNRGDEQQARRSLFSSSIQLASILSNLLLRSRALRISHMVNICLG